MVEELTSQRERLGYWNQRSFRELLGHCVNIYEGTYTPTLEETRALSVRLYELNQQVGFCRTAVHRARHLAWARSIRPAMREALNGFRKGRKR